MYYRKEIVYDRDAREYAMYLDGELVAFARSYHAAEIALDQLVFELLSGGAAHTATELDSGSDPDTMAAESTEGDSTPPDRPRYIRSPEHDLRIARGDDYAGDAWYDGDLCRTVHVAVGRNPNSGRLPAPRAVLA